MGCTMSKRVNVQSNNSVMSDSGHAKHPNEERPTSMQDEARSFRSKVGAMKMLIRTPNAYESLLRYLTEFYQVQEYLICYRDMEEIKLLDDDQLISRTAALIWRYKTSYETARMTGVGTIPIAPNTPLNVYKDSVQPMEYLIWECFGKLRQMDIANASADAVKKHLIIAQNEIIARLVMPFEDYLLSNHYKEWCTQALQLEKQAVRNSFTQQQSRSTVPFAAAALGTNGNGNGTPHSPATSVGSRERERDRADPPTQSVSSHSLQQQTQGWSPPRVTSSSKGLLMDSLGIPDILVVDDSIVTLKLTGKTLENDGHHVDRANNGQVALNLMKSRTYDVVLIDCNMPVMDGFEAVRLFREYENSELNTHNLLAPLSCRSELSSISAESGDMAEGINTRYTLNNEHRQTSLDHHDEANANNTANKDSSNAARDAKRFARQLTMAHYHQLIIGMSTMVDEVTRQRALAAGMDFFLPKPFTLQKFVDALRQSRERKLSMLRETQANTNDAADHTETGQHSHTSDAGQHLLGKNDNSSTHTNPESNVTSQPPHT